MVNEYEIAEHHQLYRWLLKTCHFLEYHQILRYLHFTLSTHWVASSFYQMPHYLFTLESMPVSHFHLCSTSKLLCSSDALILLRFLLGPCRRLFKVPEANQNSAQYDITEPALRVHAYSCKFLQPTFSIVLLRLSESH